MAYIEPCCIDRQLPGLLKDAKGGFCFFQTSGDVTLQKLMDATSRLAGDGHVLVMTTAEVDVAMLRTLAYYLRRGWTRALMLLTRTPQTELIATELAEWADRIHYATDPLVIDGQLAIIGCGEEGARRAVIIQGALMGEPDFSLSLYAGWTGTDGDITRQAIDPTLAKLKTKPAIDHSDMAEIARILHRDF